MQSNPFTYPAWDLMTLTQLDSLPYTGVSFGETVNSPGSWQGTLNIADPQVQGTPDVNGVPQGGMNYLDSSRTGRTMICVELAGAVVWGGIIWTRRYTDSTKLLQVGASEFGSYFQQRLQALDYSTPWSTTPADPMVIAQTVLADAQAVTNGSVAGGITLTLNPAAGSGQTIIASYPGTQIQTIDSIVSGLASMGYTLGFDYSFDVAYLPGTKTPHVTLNLWYPRQGRSAAQSGILVLSKDCLDWTYDEDSTKQATDVQETGGGSTTQLDASGSLPGYPLLQAAINHSSVNTESQLANMAINDLAMMFYPVTTPQLALPVPLPDPITNLIDPSKLSFGQFALGDNLIFRIDPVSGGGENTSPRFPQGLSFEWRMTNWTCTVPEKGIPSLQFVLNTPLVSVIPPIQPPLN